MPFNIQHLLDRVDLPVLAEHAGTKLKKQQRGFRGRCPICGGDTATAFSVWVEKGRQVWHCFKPAHTRAGGDAITFVQEWRSLDWLEAFKWLAGWANVPLSDLGLTPEAVAEHQAREKRADVLELAARFYARQRWQQRPRAALRYAMERRHFNHATVRRAGYGFSAGGTALRDWLVAHNADLALAREIGLLRADGRDFTANADGQAASPDGWLIYVHREHGRVVFLSARALSETDDKSRNLPGVRRMYRAEVRGDDNVIIVEGQADADSLAQVGYSSWGLCGAALTDREVAELRRAKAVYLALDNDAAQDGTPEERQERRERQAKATSRIAGLIGPLTLILPELPAGVKDFNAWLQSGELTHDWVADLCADAQPFVQLVIDKIDGCPTFEFDSRIDEACKLLNRLPDSSQARYVKALADIANLTPKSVRERMAAVASEDGGLKRAEVRAGRLCFDGQALMNASLKISSQLTQIDGLNPPKVLYSICGQLAGGQQLHTQEVPADEFLKLAWLSRYGVDVMLEVSPRDAWRVARAIQEISVGDVKRESIYTFSGWTRIEGKVAYLTTSGAITADGLNPAVRVELGHAGSNLRHYRLPAPPEDPRSAMQESLRFLDLAPLTVTGPLWAALYTAPLTVWRSLDALLWFHGLTQSQKSTLVMLGLTHYGQGFVDGTKFFSPVDWISSFVGIEHAMFTCKDLPVVIDDYTPQASEEERKKLLNWAQRVIRSLGNRSGRLLGNGDGTQRMPKPPRGLAIATAEKTLEVQSTVGRMVEIPIERGDVKLAAGADGVSPLTDAQIRNGAGGPGLYSQAMAAYIRWLAANWEQCETVVHGFYEAAHKEARGLFSGQARLLDSYAALMTGTQMALTFAVDGRAVSNAQSETHLAAIKGALTSVMQQHSRSVASHSPLRRMFEALDTLLTQGRVCLAPRGSDTFVPPDHCTLIGWYEPVDHVVYLMVTACIQVTRQFYQQAGQSFDTNNHGIVREADQTGMIRKSSEGANVYKGWMGDSNRSVLALDVSRAMDRFDVMLYPPKRNSELQMQKKAG